MFACSLLLLISLYMWTYLEQLLLSAPRFHHESVVDHFVTASCLFKSFISITQQVQWHTSNKQPGKEIWQGWVEAARQRNQTPTDRQAPLVYVVTVATAQTHSGAYLLTPSRINSLARPIWSLIRPLKCRGDFALPLIVKIKVNCIWCSEAGDQTCLIWLHQVFVGVVDNKKALL